VAHRLQTRLDHLNRLDNPSHGLTIDQANAAFHTAYDSGARPPSILIRRQFIRRPKYLELAGERDRTPRTKPPLATAIRSRGIMLKLELTLLFLAQCQRKGRVSPLVRHPVNRASDESLGLVDFLATGSNRRPNTTYRRMTESMRARQLKSALDGLASPWLQLVEIATTDRSRPDYDYGVRLHTEVGPQPTRDQQPYRLPDADRTGVVSVPIAFFINGWIQVLTDSEIANWLMWRDIGGLRSPEQTSNDDLMIWADERLGCYDLTRDAWDTHQTLTRMNLMTVVFSAGRRADGTLSGYSGGHRGEVHHFGIHDNELSKPALPAARAAIAAIRDDS
jgi:hypothetical protein